LIAVHSAKTSYFFDYDLLAFTRNNTFVINDPEPGLLRVTVVGDWTNVGAISAAVGITSSMTPTPGHTATGKISEFEELMYPVNIPAGVGQAVFTLRWKNNWSVYPTNDIVLVPLDPSGAWHLADNIYNSPQSIVVNNPTPGTWQVYLVPFVMNTQSDKFELRVTLDGQVVR